MRGFRHVLVSLGATPMARDADLVRAAADAVDEDGELTLLCVAAIAAPADPYDPLPGQTSKQQVLVDVLARERLEWARLRRSASCITARCPSSSCRARPPTTTVQRADNARAWSWPRRRGAAP